MFGKLFLAVSAKLVEEKYALVIVDSVTALFCVDFSGRGELSERQQKLGLFMSLQHTRANSGSQTSFFELGGG